MGAQSFFRRTLVVCALVFISSVSLADSIEDGAAYLSAVQRADGAIAGTNDIAISFQATSEALIALDPTHPARASAFGFLAETEISTAVTEYLARRISSGDNDAGTLQVLLERQNSDGGFGAFPSHPSIPLDTAYALQALSNTALQPQSTAAVSYLKGAQFGSGAWPGPDGAASTFVTAHAVQALWAHRAHATVATNVSAARDFLMNARTGDLWPELHESALALAALLPTMPDHGPLASAINALGAAQLPDGSWQSDAYVTALSIRALQASANGFEDRSTVIGRIIDGDTQASIAGVEIALTGPVSLSLTSDENGRFEFSVDDAGSYVLAISHPEYPATSSSINVGVGVNLDIGTVRLLKSAGSVTAIAQGTVRDAETGAPLSGVTVTSGSLQTVTDSAGQYLLLGLAPGDVEILATKSGYESALLTSQVGPGGTLLFSPSLRAGISLTFDLVGNVRDASTGLALADAAVSVEGTASGSALTGDSGEYAITGLNPGTSTIKVFRDGYHPVQQVIDAPANQTRTYSPSLRPASEPAFDLSVFGKVTDQKNEQPLAGVLVVVSHDSGVASAITAGDGGYALTIPASDTLDFTFSLDGYETVSKSHTASGYATFGLDLSLREAGPAQALVQGHVVDAETGSPIPGATVVLEVDGGTGTLTVDATGFFQSPYVPPGNARITISAAGYEPSVLDFELPEGLLDLGIRTLVPLSNDPVELSGVVLDSTNNLPIPGATVAYVFPSGSGAVPAGADGTFTFAATPRETGEITVSAAGYIGTDLIFAVDPDDADLGQIRLRPEGLDNLLPDLRVHSVGRPTPASSTTSFHVSGAVEVALTLSGGAIDAPSVRVVAFSDTNADGTYDPAHDIQLGALTVAGAEFGVEPVMRTIPVEGVLPFRDAPISVAVDADGVVVEKDETNNVRSTALQCRRIPDPSAELSVRTKWHWQGSEEFPNARTVFGPVMVGQLTDDNGDGVIDENDVPDLVFIASGSGTHLTVISGDDGRTHWQVAGPFASLGSVALADLNGDGVVDIVVPERYRHRLFAFDHTGSPLWDVQTTLGVVDTRDSVAIADLDGDGSPEIVHGNEVRRADGTLWWRGSGGAGGYRYYGYLPIVADIDLDGRPEVVAGRTVYRYNGQVYWNANVNDGFTAVGNFDDDDFAEVVHVAAGSLYLREHDGTLIWGPVRLPASGWSNAGDGGAPTVADFDGDGLIDIGIAARHYYAVYNGDGSLKWRRSVEDGSSHKTGSSLFDFDGDGNIEVAYADQERLFIFDGATGVSRFEIPNTSATTLEYPVIVDADNDGSAEIIIGSTGGVTRGVRMLESDGPGWMPTRSIWNQHSYHITNINDDGTVPAYEEPSWLVHNTYRLNTFLDRDPLDSPDLTIGALKIVDHGTGAGLSLVARVGNAGSVSSAAAVFVRFFDGLDETAPLIGSATLGVIAPGAWRDIELSGVGSLSGGVVTAVIDAGGSFDCDASNDSVQQTLLPSLGTATAATDKAQYAPEESVQIGVTVENTGSFTHDYFVDVYIEDAAGNLVEALPPLSVSGVAPGSTSVATTSWNTGLVISGEYRVRITLRDAAGQVLYETTTPFAIAHDPLSGPVAALRVTTDRPVYHTSDVVLLDFLAQNLSVSTHFNASTVEIQVTGPTGVPFEATLAVHALTPGSASALIEQHVLAAAAEGSYTVDATWRGEGGQIVAIGTAQFEVLEDLTKSLVGTVALAATEVFKGDTLLCTEDVTNIGTRTVTVPVRRVTAAIDDSDTRMGIARDVTLAPSGMDTHASTVGTDDFAEMHYACIVQAEIDGEWHSLAHAVFEVLPVPIRIEAALAAGSRGRLLMLLDPACDELDPAQPSGGACDEDPYGPVAAPGLPIQRQHLESVLEAAGWHVTIVTSIAAFEAEFLSGGYETYALFNEQLKLSEALQDQVAVDIADGRGLLVAGDHDRRNGRLEAALGVQSLGKNYDATAVVLEPIAGHPGGEIQLPILEKPNAMKGEGATAIGLYRVAPAGSLETGMTRYDHGAGTGIYAGFDFPMQSAADGDDGEWASVLSATLTEVHPEPYLPIAGRVFPLELELTNEGIAVAGEVHLALPTGASLVSGPPDTVTTGDVSVWPFTLGEGEVKLQRVWVRLPETVGIAEVMATVFTHDDDELVERAQVQILLNVQPKE